MGASTHDVQRAAWGCGLRVHAHDISIRDGTVRIENVNRWTCEGTDAMRRCLQRRVRVTCEYSTCSMSGFAVIIETAPAPLLVRVARLMARATIALTVLALTTLLAGALTSERHN